MAQKVCDRSPCVNLQAAIPHFMIPRSQIKDGMLASIKDNIESNDLGPDKLRPVVLKYCPFCGTRIENNHDFAEWVAKNVYNMRT